MGNRKSKWSFSRHRYLTAPPPPPVKPPQPPSPPQHLVCPISGTLMADPIIVASGQTFERSFIHACNNLGVSEVTLANGFKIELGNGNGCFMVPNIAIKATILEWCETHGVEQPNPVEVGVAEKVVKGLGLEFKVDVSEMDLLEAVEITPPVGGGGKFVKAATELNRRTRGSSHFYSSSSEDSVVSTIPDTPLPLSTRPCCYSSSTSSSSMSSEMETLLSEEEEEMIGKLKSIDMFEQKEAVTLLRNITKSNEKIRGPICSNQLLVALKPLLDSRYAKLQVNAVAAVVNMSLEKANKVKIMRSGIVPVLINMLKGEFAESQEHAAGAIFSLALDDENKTAIGVLGAMPPLFHMLRSESERGRNDAALALYHLSLDNNNRTKLIKLGCVPTLIALVRSKDLASRALLILCNLAASHEGCSTMLDSNAVECFVGILREIELGSNMNAMTENCISALYALSQGSLRFIGLAKDAGAVEVLRKLLERLSERARDKSLRMLEMMRSPTEREEHQQDWENIIGSIVGSGVTNWNGHKSYKGDGEANSSGF